MAKINHRMSRKEQELEKEVMLEKEAYEQEKLEQELAEAVADAAQTAEQETALPEKAGSGAAKAGLRKGMGKKKLTKRKKLVPIGAGVAAAVVVGVLGMRFMGARKVGAAAMAVQRTATVQRMDIVSSLSSSGTLSPKDTYNITSLASGEVIQADFEEGDQVTEGQVLYVIDSSSMESELRSAQNSLERAQSSYDLAAEEYNEALEKYSDHTYKATENGYIKTLYVSEGDKVSGNTKLADIYNDKVMKLRIPFLSTDASGIGVGNEGLITLSDTGEQLAGVVTAIGNMEETLAGGRLVRYITMRVDNPGGLTESMSASVQIGPYMCAQEGTFKASVNTVMSEDLSTSVEIASMLVNEGDYVGEGSAVFQMTEKTGNNLIRTYKDSMDKAQESLESAQSKLENTQDSYENYTITAPISGTVITKSVKAGDKISAGGNNAATLATIYDLSQLTFEMSVDELDVQSVHSGLSVEIAADAFEGQTFTGKVTNVSLQSSYSNGVTNYPVTVTLNETGSLLPGMNVDGSIILEQAEDVLVVPVDALMRGNRVYVKDETVTEAQGNVPAGFRAVQVETGLMNDDYVEIVSGLEEGDQVYVSESSVSSNMMMMPGGMPGGMPSGGMPSGGMPSGGGNRQGGGMPGGGRP